MGNRVKEFIKNELEWPYTLAERGRSISGNSSRLEKTQLATPGWQNTGPNSLFFEKHNSMAPSRIKTQRQCYSLQPVFVIIWSVVSGLFRFSPTLLKIKARRKWSFLCASWVSVYTPLDTPIKSVGWSLQTRESWLNSTPCDILLALPRNTNHALLIAWLRSDLRRPREMKNFSKLISFSKLIRRVASSLAA